MNEKITQPCVCCGDACLVDREKWHVTEAPAALCIDCAVHIYFRNFPWPVVKTLYTLRSQVMTLLSEKELMKRDIRRLFSAQQDLEQAALRA